jgi:hypothetical protein
MNKAPYTKTALSYADQLQQLKNRGLTIEDDTSNKKNCILESRK